MLLKVGDIDIQRTNNNNNHTQKRRRRSKKTHRSLWPKYLAPLTFSQFRKSVIKYHMYILYLLLVTTSVPALIRFYFVRNMCIIYTQNETDYYYKLYKQKKTSCVSLSFVYMTQYTTTDDYVLHIIIICSCTLCISNIRRIRD